MCRGLLTGIYRQINVPKVDTRMAFSSIRQDATIDWAVFDRYALESGIAESHSLFLDELREKTNISSFSYTLISRFLTVSTESIEGDKLSFVRWAFPYISIFFHSSKSQAEPKKPSTRLTQLDPAKITETCINQTESYKKKHKPEKKNPINEKNDCRLSDSSQRLVPSESASCPTAPSLLAPLSTTNLKFLLRIVWIRVVKCFAMRLKNSPKSFRKLDLPLNIDKADLTLGFRLPPIPHRIRAWPTLSSAPIGFEFTMIPFVCQTLLAIHRSSLIIKS